MNESTIQCNICMDLINNTHNICITPCNHSFCFPCMIKMISYQRYCPCCRTELVPESHNIRHNFDGTVYFGEVRNNLPHGRGKMIYENGIVFEGEFLNGMIHGTGTIYNSFAGDIMYKGSFSDGTRHGVGKTFYNITGCMYNDFLHIPNVTMYEGNYIYGHASGKGKLYIGEHLLYDGTIINNQFHGTGKYVNIFDTTQEVNTDLDCRTIVLHCNGIQYEGEFKDGLPNGHGILTFINGEIYAGNFEYGKINGFGKWIKQDTIIYGYWRNNAIANGYSNWKLDENTQCTGKMVNGFLNGYVNLKMVNGDTYSGHMKYNLFHGKGTYTYANKSFYKGDWRCGQKDGWGSMQYSTNTIFYGQWSNNVQNGYGQYSVDNISYQGFWTSGVCLNITYMDNKITDSKLKRMK